MLVLFKKGNASFKHPAEKNVKNIVAIFSNYLRCTYFGLK